MTVPTHERANPADEDENAKIDGHQKKQPHLEREKRQLTCPNPVQYCTFPARTLHPSRRRRKLSGDGVGDGSAAMVAALHPQRQ